MPHTALKPPMGAGVCSSNQADLPFKAEKEQFYSALNNAAMIAGDAEPHSDSHVARPCCNQPSIHLI